MHISKFWYGFFFYRFYGITVNNSTTLNQVRQVFNPYIYGHSVEVSPKKGGSYTVKKLMLFGRIARELSYIMPDDRTFNFSIPIGFYHTFPILSTIINNRTIINFCSST